MDEMIEFLDKLCRFRSVAQETGNPEAPYGQEVHDALMYVLETCEGFGMRVKNCNNQVGWAEIGDGDEMIGILVHLDVVPEGKGWDTEPFSATIVSDKKGEKLCGRGVVDDKGPAAACIFAMKDIARLRMRLKRRIRIIFGQSEETGDWPDMEYYRNNEELPVFGFTPDGDFPAIYGEKGILNLKLSMPREKSGILSAKGGNAHNMVPDYAEITLNINDSPVKISENGVSAHGAMPEIGENAISKAFLTAQEKGAESPFVKFYCDKIGSGIYGEKIGVDLSDDKSGRLTFNVGVLQCNENECSIIVNMRCPVSFDGDEIEAIIKSECEPYGVEVTRLEWTPPVYMPKDSGTVAKLTEVYRSLTGDMTEPKVIGGGTYARAMKNIVAFGPCFPDMEMTEHQKNEYIPLDKFLKLREIYREAILRLADV